MNKTSINNSPSFGAYFSTKNAIHLKRLCKGEFGELSKYRLKEKLDWFTKELPNHELEITQFENLPNFNVRYDDIIMPRHPRIRDRGIGVSVASVIDKVTKGISKYTITNKETGNSVNIFADDIFQFLDGIKEKSGTLFNKTQKSLTEGLDSFGKEIMNKLTTKQ